MIDFWRENGYNHAEVLMKALAVPGETEFPESRRIMIIRRN
jgi:hypothetical protein